MESSENAILWESQDVRVTKQDKKTKVAYPHFVALRYSV